MKKEFFISDIWLLLSEYWTVTERLKFLLFHQRNFQPQLCGTCPWKTRWEGKTLSSSLFVLTGWIFNRRLTLNECDSWDLSDKWPRWGGSQMLPITISVCQLFSFFQMCSVYVLYLKTEVNMLPVQMLSDGETNTICLHKKNWHKTNKFKLQKYLFSVSNLSL